jgi:hypothetical protein
MTLPHCVVLYYLYITPGQHKSKNFLAAKFKFPAKMRDFKSNPQFWFVFNKCMYTTMSKFSNLPHYFLPTIMIIIYCVKLFDLSIFTFQRTRIPCQNWFQINFMAAGGGGGWNPPSIWKIHFGMSEPNSFWHSHLYIYGQLKSRRTSLCLQNSAADFFWGFPAFRTAELIPPH